MRSFDDIFTAFGGNASLAEILDARDSTVSEMKRRGSIPPDYWPDLIAAAEARGIKDVDYETLTRLYIGARPPRRRFPRQIHARALGATA